MVLNHHDHDHDLRSTGSMLAVSVEEVATMAFMRLLNTHKTHFGNMSKPSH